MREQQVNVATVTPAYLSVLNELPQRCRDSLATLRLLILGGAYYAARRHQIPEPVIPESARAEIA